MPSKLDPMAKARDFLYTPRPRVRPISPARRMDQIARQAREASVSAAISGGGGSGVPIFDTLPDATPEDVGSIIYVAGAAGQPAQGYIGVQTQSDTVIWEPIFTQAFYGAATEFTDEFYTSANWTFSGSSEQNVGAAGHPGTHRISTAASINAVASYDFKGRVKAGDIGRSAFILRPLDSTSVTYRVGFGDGVTPSDGIYAEKDAGEGAWRLVKAIGGGETRTTTTLTLTTSHWYLLQVENLDGGMYKLTLYDLTDPATFTPFSTILTGLDEDDFWRPFFYLQTANASLKQLDCDYYWIRHTPTVRS